MLAFYDSGIGGKTISDSFKKLRPDIAFSYFADSEFLPLGEKSADQIYDRICQVCLELFENQKIDLIVLACNTAAVNSIRKIQNEWLPANYPTKKVLSITKPITEYLDTEKAYLKDLKGLVLATEATIKSGFYQQEYKKIGYHNLDFIAAPGLALAIEKVDTIKIHKILTNLLAPYSTTIDFLILNCTHYPLIKKLYQNYFDKPIEVVDSSDFIAQRLVWYLKKHYHLT